MELGRLSRRTYETPAERGNSLDAPREPRARADASP